MKCNYCYKNMRLELKVKNKYGVIEKWKCNCGKQSVRAIKGNEIRIK
ncbi:hypothetical protein [uncultured Clostridium sp.]|nr:hypothetical protein [uncultured Clostridium sp.]